MRPCRAAVVLSFFFHSFTVSVSYSSFHIILCSLFVSYVFLSTLTELIAFDIFILLTILANCIVLALDHPLPNDDKSKISDDLVGDKIYTYITQLYHG